MGSTVSIMFILAEKRVKAKKLICDLQTNSSHGFQDGVILEICLSLLNGPYTGNFFYPVHYGREAKPQINHF